MGGIRKVDDEVGTIVADITRNVSRYCSSIVRSSFIIFVSAAICPQDRGSGERKMVFTSDRKWRGAPRDKKKEEIAFER